MDEIVIDGQIGGWEVDVQEILAQINAATGDLVVKLNSIGGSVIGGVSIFNALKSYNKGSVTIEIDAVAASIASYIALAGDKVIAHSNSMYMIHNAWLPTVGDFIKLRKAADISEGLSSIIANGYVSKTKMGKSEALSLMAKETFYYGAEIKTAGFVDEIIDVDSTTDKAAAYSVTLEGLKACNKAVLEHESVDFEAVAALLPSKEVSKPEAKVADVSAQQKRERDLFILKQGMN